MIPGSWFSIVHTDLLIMCCLEHIGNHCPFRQFKIESKMCPEEHRRFFKNIFLPNTTSYFWNFEEDVETFRIQCTLSLNGHS